MGERVFYDERGSVIVNGPGDLDVIVPYTAAEAERDEWIDNYPDELMSDA